MNTATSQPEEYDLLVLGSGEAGKYIAWPLASKGTKIAVIERKYIRGSCPNIECLPSKNVIHSAKVAAYFRRSEEFGIAKDNWKINMPAVHERKRRMVNGLVEMHMPCWKDSSRFLQMCRRPPLLPLPTSRLYTHDLRLESKLSLVGGSTAGIGFAIAKAAAAGDARVTVNGTS